MGCDILLEEISFSKWPIRDVLEDHSVQGTLSLIQVKRIFLISGFLQVKHVLIGRKQNATEISKLFEKQNNWTDPRKM